MNKLRRIPQILNATDFLVVSFYLFLTLINLIFYSRVDDWFHLVCLNIVFVCFVVGLAYYDEKKSNILSSQLRYWYLVPMVLLTFKEIYLMIKPIRQIDYDQLLIQADRFLFGTDPTVALFSISNPLLTEILQIAYATFFFLPVILAIDLMMSDRMKEVKYEAFIIVYGFFLSYIGYFLVPAIGPRFTLHEFAAVNSELPGLFFTNFLREVVNAGESIQSTTINAAEIVQRDCFPSGHAQMTLLIMYLSVKFKSKVKYFILPDGILLIFATVYLRYHYVVDIIAGAIFMVFTLWTGKYLYNWWTGLRGEEKFTFAKD